MEYVNFIGIVALLGVALKLIPYIFSLRKNGLFSRQRSGPEQTEIVPPPKRTISGLTYRDLEKIEFDNRLDCWQKSYETRRQQLRASTDSITGEKYRFEQSGMT